MQPPIECHLPVIYGQQTAFELLQHNTELTPENLSLCFEHGAVWLETAGKPRRLYDKTCQLKRGHKLHLYCNESTLTPCPYQATLIEDMGSFSIWCKPGGMLSQGSKWGDHWTIQRWIEQHALHDRKCLITHRLDRFTEGLMIIAHEEAINRQFHRMFEQHRIEKTYRAIVSGQIASETPIIASTPVQGKPAKSVLRVIEYSNSLDQTLVEIQPKSGRKHQIRIHLAELGHPVLNDRQYGREPFTGDLKLQASKLAFKHPLEQTALSFSMLDSDLLRL